VRNNICIALDVTYSVHVGMTWWTQPSKIEVQVTAITEIYSARSTYVQDDRTVCQKRVKLTFVRILDACDPYAGVMCMESVRRS